MLRNRSGRKRKQGRRTPSGELAAPAVNYRKMAGEQPHRCCLPERYREDHRAGTELGNLLLTGKLGAHGRDGKISDRAQALHEAGRRYAGTVSRYWAMIGSPRSGSGGLGKGFSCMGDVSCGLDQQGKRIAPCECRNRTEDYNNTFEVLERIGHLVHVVVNRVAVHDLPCPPDHVPALKFGLGALAREFGLRG